MKSDWKLHVLGTRGSWPVSGREFLEFGCATSCYILTHGDYALVIDCGSGLSGAGGLLKGCSRVDVLLTHLHYDHLMGLLSFGVFPPNAQLRFVSRFSRWFGEDTLRRFMSPPFWPYTPDFGVMMEVPEDGKIELEEGVRVQFSPSNHPDGASIMRIDGPDWAMCVAFDYEHTAPFPEALARGCDLLLYDGMFTRDEYDDHVGWGHSHWEEGCALARRAGVRRLLITHHSPDRTDPALRAMEREAQQIFADAAFARVGDVVILSKKEAGI